MTDYIPVPKVRENLTTNVAEIKIKGLLYWKQVAKVRENLTTNVAETKNQGPSVLETDYILVAKRPIC